MLYAMRFSLPDRPGMLGSVATALSHTGASIVQLNVIDRDGGYAVDEVCLETDLNVPAEHLRRAAEGIPGVVVEALRPVDRAPDPLGPLVLAERLTAGTGDPVRMLVDGLPEALSATWAIAFDVTDDLRVLAATPGAPVPGTLETPWLPLAAARRLELADWMPPRWRLSRLELAAAPLDSPARCVVIGRRTGMRFRGTEIRQIDVLAGMAMRPRALAQVV